MNFAFSDEQDELRATLRRFFEERSPLAKVREVVDTADGFDRALWSEMATELGLCGLHIAEVDGGQGFSLIEAAIVAEEMGRALLPSPYFASAILAASAIYEFGTAQERAELLPAIASGETIATFAFSEEAHGWDPARISVKARASGDGFVLSGSKTYVPEAMVADVFVVIAVVEGQVGPSCFWVKGDAPGLARSPLVTMDQTRRQGLVTLNETPARAIGIPGEGSAALAATLDIGSAMIAAELAGVAQRCLEMSVEYAKTRVQFGRPIGSFQAIKHKCSDMLVETESSKSAAYYAAWAAAEGRDELPVVASIAKSYCAEAAFHAAAETIQIHGGVGFTWEHDAHLYFKRARSSGVLLGDAGYHRTLIAERALR